MTGKFPPTEEYRQAVSRLDREIASRLRARIVRTRGGGLWRSAKRKIRALFTFRKAESD